MWKKGLILLSCLFLFSGCSFQRDNEINNNLTDNPKNLKDLFLVDEIIKRDLMEQMDKLMDHHDSNMNTQRTMIQDFNSLNQLGDSIKQSINQ